MTYFFEKLQDLMLSGRYMKLIRNKERSSLILVKNMNYISPSDTNTDELISHNEKCNKRIHSQINEEINFQVIIFKERLKQKHLQINRKRFINNNSKKDVNELLQDFLIMFNMIYKVKVYSGPMQRALKIGNIIYNQQVFQTQDYDVKIKEMELLKMLEDGKILMT